MINRTEARYGAHDVNAPAMCLRTPVDDAVACSDNQNTTFQHPPPGHVFCGSLVCACTAGRALMSVRVFS